MRLRHAFGFLLVGAVLGFLPRIAPGWCPASGVDGSSARELWLHVMSVLNVTLAGSYLSGRVLAVLAVAMKYPPQPAAIAAPAVAPVARRHAVVRAAARSREPELAFGPRLAVAAQAG